MNHSLKGAKLLTNLTTGAVEPICGSLEGSVGLHGRIR